MFEGIQHVGYWVGDLGKGVAWFERVFGGEIAGGGRMPDSRITPGGGRNAFVRFGAVEVELMEPGDTRALPKDTLVMHHVGYIVSDIGTSAERLRGRGLRFLADAPFTNVMEQRVLYFDPDTTNGVWMHLTEVPAAKPLRRDGPTIDGIVHPGIRVADVDRAAQWYVDNLGGVVVGKGPSRAGGRVAFIDCGRAQVELIEPPDAARLGASHVLDHVGYLASALDDDIAAYKALGLAFATDAAAVNPIGQRLIYFDTASSMGARMHLTALP